MGDLAPPTLLLRHRSEWHNLFCAPQFHLSKKSFNDVCQLEALFFKALPGNFYKNGTHSLPNKWGIVVDNNGGYIVN